jgi:hypothetical protein
LHLDLWNHDIGTGRKDVVFQPSERETLPSPALRAEASERKVV